MVKRQLGGTVDEFSADQEISKSKRLYIHLWKIWSPAPSKTGSYSRQAASEMKFGRGMTF